MPDELEKAVSKVEDRVEKAEAKIEDLEDRVSIVENILNSNETQIKRLQSHIESELGLTRKDVIRFEERMFGKGDDEYGGRFGQLTKRLYRMEVVLLSIGMSATILAFLFAAFQFMDKASK